MTNTTKFVVTAITKKMVSTAVTTKLVVTANSYYDGAGRIGILLRILPPGGPKIADRAWKGI